MNYSIITPTILDVEASGFGHDSYPIEVGVVTGEQKRYCSLIKPQPKWTYWDKDAEALHGISRDLLKQRGLAPTEIAIELNNLLYGQTVYSDGWVVDHPWMIKLFNAAGLSMQFRLSALEMILNEKQMAIWHSVKDKLHQESRLKRHRASTDASIIQQTFVTTQHMSSSVSRRKPA